MRIPRYKQVVDALAAELRAGRWPVGTRLPTHRELAAREGIALVTATRVYAKLAIAGRRELPDALVRPSARGRDLA